MAENPSLLLSICIPAYNGAKTLRRTLDSMVSQIASGNARPRMEIVICDDASQDDTLAIARDYAERHAFIRVHENPKNLGMDGNFRQTALHAQGRFVWFSGQDDVFGAGVVAKVLGVLEAAPDLGFVFINYSQVSHDMNRVLLRSFLEQQAYDKAALDESRDLVFATPDEFFAFCPVAPMFLPATVIRRDFWLDTDVSAYVGTAFIQTAIILLNFHRAKMYVVTKPFIQGRIPDDQWQTKGQSFFQVFLGFIVMETLVYRDPRNPTPASVYEKKKRTFLKNLFPLARKSRHMGMRPVPEFLDKLALVYGRGPVFWLYILPIMRAPLFVLDGLSAIYQVKKRFAKDTPPQRRF